MTVCRYYLQGTCRFGDRCRFEHVDPDHGDDRSNYSNRRQDYGYRDGYNQQRGYQDRYQSYQDHDLSYGPRRNVNYERQNQRYGSASYDDQNESNTYYRQANHSNTKERYHQQNYSDKYYSNERYEDPERKNNSRFNNFNPPSPENRSNKYDRTQYEWVSDDYKKQSQSQKSYEEKSTNKSHSSSKNFSFKDSAVYEAEDETNEETLILTEMVKEDMTAWELGNQWPLTCYSPFTKRAGFPGFNDVSFEELRHEALLAQENNTFDSYIENVAKTILDVQHKRNKLKEPTSQLISIVKKLKNGESFNDESNTKGGHFLSTSSQNTLDMFPEQSPPLFSQNSAASFSFKSIPEEEQSIKAKASAFSFQSIFDTNTAASNSSSFSFKLPADDKLPVSSVPTKSDSIECSLYTLLDNLSSQDKEQFLATTFTLGKIPTVPPPKQLCF